MTKTTISAPANIAFIKYWGARDLDRALPLNASISMTLERCVTQCTAEVIPGDQDEIWLAESHGGFSTPKPEYHRRIKQQLDPMRQGAPTEERLPLATPHPFPPPAPPPPSPSCSPPPP